MPLTELDKKNAISRILLSRFRLLNDYPFYGLLLMHMKFGLDEECSTAYTNGSKISFSPKFLDELTNEELDFVMQHEILHVVLRHCFRGKTVNPLLFNIACDIVVNSNILYSHGMNINSITLKEYGEAMHITPIGTEGYNHTAEEVYEMLIKSMDKEKMSGGMPGSGVIDGVVDDHSHWGEENDNKELQDAIDAAMSDAIISIEKRSKTCGGAPLGALRRYKAIKDNRVNWKTVLHDFLTFEVTDYSFNPPDKRYQDGFYIPDYNEIHEKNINVFFEIDTSGSISDNDLGYALAEVKACIEAYPECVNGYVCCCDAQMYEPIPIEDIKDVASLKLQGGGGTDFGAIFDCLEEFDITPDVIVIITDGYGEFPEKSEAENIPVLWLINNNEVTPPWGMIARIGDTKE